MVRYPCFLHDLIRHMTRFYFAIYSNFFIERFIEPDIMITSTVMMKSEAIL